MNLSQLASTGVSLTSLSISTVTGAAKFLLSDSVAIRTAVEISIPSIVTARMGAKLAARCPDDVLQLAFNAASVVLIPTHFLVQRNAARRWSAADEDEAVHQDASRTPPIRNAAFGCVSGIVSAIMGVGGLPLTMSYLTAFAALPHHLVQGTAMLAVAPSAITSAASRMSVIPPGTAAAVSVGAMCGATFGSSVALRTSEERLRGLYMFSLVALGGRSVWAATRNLQSIWARYKRNV